MFSLSAHAAGRSSVVLHGGKVITGGSDGILKRFANDPTGSEAISLEELRNEGEKQIVCLSSMNNNILIALDEEEGMRYQVRVLDGNSFETNTMISKGQLGVRDAALNVDATWAAIATEGDGLRIVQVADMVNVKEYKDQQGAVKSVTWDPLNEFLVTTGADASLIVRNVPSNSEEDFTVKGKVSSLLKKEDATGSSTQAELICRPRWNRDGSLLAVPCNNSKIALIKRDAIVDGSFATQAFTFLTKDADANYTVRRYCVCVSFSFTNIVKNNNNNKIAAWSSNDKYLACVSNKEEGTCEKERKTTTVTYLGL